MKYRVLTAATWLVATLVATIAWSLTIGPLVDWGAALQNWLAPLGVLGILIGFSLVNTGISQDVPPSGNIATWGGYALGLLSFASFLYSWGEQGYSATNMLYSGVGAMLILGTSAMFVDFIRAVSQKVSHRSAWLSTEEY